MHLQHSPLLVQLRVSFFDAPNLRRWLDRDPLGEGGFEALANGSVGQMGDGANYYAFVRNSPIDSFD